jgi:ABC-type transport system involved in multi-copper enzyme maturation permease subunit
MRTVLIIASLTVREAVRRRLVAALAAISIVSVALSGWGFYRLSHTRALTSGETSGALPDAFILFAFMFSFVVALSASAIASPSVSGEIEAGVLQAVVARPVRRSEILLGKWLGLVGLLAAYTAVVSGLQVAVVYLASRFVPPNPAAAAAFLLAEGVVLLTLVLMLSTRLSALAAGVVGVALFGLAWLGGVAGALGAAFGVHSLHTASEISQYLLPTDGLWHGAVYYLEPSYILQSLRSLGQPGLRAQGPFFAQTPPTWQYLTWAGIWLVLVLALGLVSLKRREL